MKEASNGSFEKNADSHCEGSHSDTESFSEKLRDKYSYSHFSYFDKLSGSPKSDLVTIESAMEFAEVGLFQILVLIPCLVAFSTTTMMPNIFNKFSNAIQCDLQLNQKEKEIMNEIVHTCMILGGICFSTIADTMSRKWTLIFALITNAFSTAGIFFSGTFFTFSFFRGVSTFCSSGIIAITIVYLAEFQNRYNRGTIICFLQFSWVIGVITIPELAFLWKTRILWTTLPMLLAVLGLTFFPDSPRFLLSRGRDLEALKAIKTIYATNTKKHPSTFPNIELVENPTAYEIETNSPVKQYIPGDLKINFVCFLVLIFSQFVLFFSYYTMSLYFPDLVIRQETFLVPKNETFLSHSNCRIGVGAIYGFPKNETFGSKKTNFFLRKQYKIRNVDSCQKQKQKPEDFYTKKRLVIALCCLSSTVLLIYGIDTAGRKIFLLSSHIFLAVFVFVAYFLHTENQVLIFSCIFEALTTLSVASGQCLAVEMFPTRIRVLGISFIIGANQLGIFTGNAGVTTKMAANCVWMVTFIAYILTSAYTVLEETYQIV